MKPRDTDQIQSSPASPVAPSEAETPSGGTTTTTPSVLEDKRSPLIAGLSVKIPMTPSGSTQSYDSQKNHPAAITLFISKPRTPGQSPGTATDRKTPPAKTTGLTSPNAASASVSRSPFNSANKHPAALAVTWIDPNIVCIQSHHRPNFAKIARAKYGEGNTKELPVENTKGGLPSLIKSIDMFARYLNERKAINPNIKVKWDGEFNLFYSGENVKVFDAIRARLHALTGIALSDITIEKEWGGGGSDRVFYREEREFGLYNGERKPKASPLSGSPDTAASELPSPSESPSGSFELRRPKSTTSLFDIPEGETNTPFADRVDQSHTPQ